MALVTGAGRGIGRATALLLAERGMRVMATARSRVGAAVDGLDYVTGDLMDAGRLRRAWPRDRRAAGADRGAGQQRRAGLGRRAGGVAAGPDVWRETMALNLDAPVPCSAGRRCPTWSSAGAAAASFVSSTAGLFADVRHERLLRLQGRAAGADAGLAADGGATASPRTRCCRAGFAPRWPSGRPPRRPRAAASRWSDVGRARGQLSGRPRGYQAEVAETIAFLCAEARPASTASA